MKLTPQQKKIVDMLRDGLWHCPTKECFIKDDRKRISELSRMRTFDGKKIYNIEGQPCTLHPHTSRVYMRRLVGLKPKPVYQYDPTSNTMKLL
jgi:hypothetical protein